MCGFRLLTLVTAFSSLALAGTAYLRPRDDSTAATKASVVVTGAKGAVRTRMEIHDLKANADQWNIYLLALQRFQQINYTDPMSWYAICGIHGYPFAVYDGVQKCSNCSDTGYCTHESTIFPEWHRVYLLLFEQALQQYALAVAALFSGADKQKYTDAANSLACPYFDWAQREFCT
jgi:tyrosinase